MSWRRHPVKHLAEVSVSNVDKTSDAGETPVRLVNYTDVYYGDRLAPSPNLMEATASPRQIEVFRLRPGDVVITKDSETAEDIGVPAYVEASADDMVLGYHLALLRPRQGLVDGRYLYWAMSSDDARGQLSTGATGVTRFGLRTDVIRSTVISAPAVAEQRAIADHLDTETARIDTLINKKRRLAELVEERRIALTDHVLLNAEGTERPVAALGTYINGWPFKPGDFTVEGRPVVRIQQLLDPDAPLDRFDGALPAKVHLSDGDLVFSWSGSLQVRVWDRGPAYLNQHLFRVVPLEGVDGRWLRFALDTATRLFDRYMHGSAMTHITKPMMKEVRLPVPRQQDQLAVAQDLETEWNSLDKVSSQIIRQIDLLQEHRQVLITAAVTGELEVPGVAG